MPYPAESRGNVPRPGDWKSQTHASVAMGYEMNATLLQVAQAYVSIANDGVLLQPALIREVRDADGNVMFTHQRTVVRRVLEPSTTKVMRTILASVVDSGTAVAADLATFDLAGKSGTARRAVNGKYDGTYNATFAALFPAQAPQYVIVVRLIDPKGKSIFGGTVAGRVVNSIVQGALATRDASLDRNALAAVTKPLPTPKAKPLSPKAVLAAQRDTARFDSLKAPAPAPVAPLATPTRVIVSLPFKNAGKSGSARRAATTDDEPSGDALPLGELREVPSVFGLDTRQAMRALHAAGFHVSVIGGGTSRTKPAAGTLARSGSVVVLETPK
jgi:cell division protein FtsI (penicillin-binding protein 3)